MYPVTIEVINLAHEAGSKFYQVVVLTDCNNNALAFRRWGKMRATGLVKTEFGRTSDVTFRIGKLIDQKERRGYYCSASTTYTAHYHDDVFDRMRGVHSVYALTLEEDGISSLRRFLENDSNHSAITEDVSVSDETVPDQNVESASWGLF